MPQSLKQSVQDALRVYAPLNATRATITVTVEDSKVILSGHVPSTSSRRMAGVLAASVNGVNEVVNELISAPELERAVAAALAEDSRTHSWPIRVRVDLGYIQLQGCVPDEEAIKTVLEVAHKVDGAKHVVSALKIQPPLPVAA